MLEQVVYELTPVYLQANWILTNTLYWNEYAAWKYALLRLIIIITIINIIIMNVVDKGSNVLSYVIHLLSDDLVFSIFFLGGLYSVFLFYIMSEM